MSDFHLISLQLGSEAQMLERALPALAAVSAGEIAFLPEYLAWTPEGSHLAYKTLVTEARQRGISIVTTLNLGGELVPDLPGGDPERRYNALAIFTRHGVVHVPQAKVSTQSFEMDPSVGGPGIGVAPYHRLNLVQLDVDDKLVAARFIICSDMMALARFAPPALSCDLLVVLGNFAYGAEEVTEKLLGVALTAGVARTALLVNAFHVPRGVGQQPLAIKAEEVLDATGRRGLRRRWGSPKQLRDGFYVYEDAAATDFVSMCHLPREGRVAVPRSRWEAPLEVGDYPVTVVL